MDHRHRCWIPLLPFVLGALVLAGQGALLQDPDYHAFADQRSWLGVAHGQNVLSNALFLVAGLLGLSRCRSLPRHLVAAGTAVSVGLVLTAIGSAVYHGAPDNASLFWDRLPLATTIMALLVLGYADRLDGRAQALLVPALLLGGASVGWWALLGDLRPYAWVQFGGLLSLVLVLVVGKAGAIDGRGWWIAMFAYGLAKMFEMTDASVLAATGGTVSGHALKHVVAGLGAIAIVGAFVGRHDRLPGPGIGPAS